MDFPIVLGSDNKFTIDERALKHIFDGEFTQRVERQPGVAKAIVTRVLAGGLHTYSALKNFFNEHPGIVSLDAFDPLIDRDWFYIRELQNKVLTVKIPQILYSGKAANITKQPELFYKSGYLWKTLFPKHFSQADIINSISQALINIDTEHSGTPSSPETDYHIIGYANLHNPMTAIRIQIQLQGNKIRSAFPSWSQPWTGNNGKAFSHADSISFIISESTERAPPEHYKQSKLFRELPPNYNDLKELTPIFTITKTIPPKQRANDEWRENRFKALEKIANSLNQNQVRLIQNFLCDHALTKEFSFQQHMLYASGIPNSGNPLDFNTCQISQNIYECFYTLLKYDNSNKTSFFLECMCRFLSATVIHAGGIHLFELKRLQKLFITGSIEHHRSDSVKLFLESFAFSPSRAATYHEFNLNTYLKKYDELSMATIGFPFLELPIEPKVLLDFIELNLGENYLIVFSKEQRQVIAKKIVFGQISENHIQDAFRYFTGSDFDFFAKHLPIMLETQGKDLIDDKSLERIVRDYHRMLVMYRQRVVLEDPVAYKANRFDYDFMSPEFCETTIQQHKRQLIVIMHELFLQKSLAFSKTNNINKIAILCERLLKELNKEGVPLPLYIPEYIDSWMKDKEFERTSEQLDLSVFDR
ncbi:hypothetical protein QF019_002100 [Pseudomonas frederiksbergensis]|uniref:hypothetical protein n=1 Tax=Pseudomonas frederiksbergensis TaxID=104087 RepID=UPI003D22D504